MEFPRPSARRDVPFCRCRACGINACRRRNSFSPFRAWQRRTRRNSNSALDKQQRTRRGGVKTASRVRNRFHSSRPQISGRFAGSAARRIRISANGRTCGAHRSELRGGVQTGDYRLCAMSAVVSTRALFHADGGFSLRPDKRRAPVFMRLAESPAITGDVAAVVFAGAIGKDKPTLPLSLTHSLPNSHSLPDNDSLRHSPPPSNPARRRRPVRRARAGIRWGFPPPLSKSIR